MADRDDSLEPKSALPELPELWRAPEEWAGSDEFRDMMTREFPDDVDTWTDPVTRRQFMTLMTASAALAGLNGCSPRPAPQRKIVPYTTIPNGMTPGVPQFFATATLLGGVATGVLAKSHEGRPVKIEGNPSHPGSLGGTDVFSQAAILGLYDPDRDQGLSFLGAQRTWDDAIATLRMALDKVKKKEGASIRILSETITSPTLAAYLDKFLQKYPKAKWIQYDPINRDNVREGATLAFGSPLTTLYDFTKAHVVLALDADFFTCGPGAVRYTHDFMTRRRVRQAKADGGKPDDMNRLYVVEPMLTSTGAVADHRLPLKGADVTSFALALARELKVPGVPEAGTLSDLAKAWLKPLAADLQSEKNKGKSIVIVGDHQPAALHALAHAINAHLGNVGTTVQQIAPIEARPELQVPAFKELVDAMNANEVELLFILGGNPVFNAPADIGFAAALDKVKLRVHHGEYQDETAAHCHWHIPATHFLEAFGDARGYDGTVTILQRLIAPLYHGHSALEFIASLGSEPTDPDSAGLALVQNHWKKWFFASSKLKTEEDFEHFWHESLRTGIVAGTSKPAPSKLVAPSLEKVVFPAPASGGYEVNFRPDPTIYDGRFANNGWLQELPKPISKLCWDNAAILSPKTAKQLEITASPQWTAGEHGRIEVHFVELTLDGRKVTAAAWIQPGHVDDSVTVYLGHGRQRAGRVGNGTGFDAYRIRSSNALWTTAGLGIRRLDEKTFLACTQGHYAMEGRKPIRRMTAEQYKNPSEQNEAMAPAVGAAEKDLIYENVPGPKERIEKAKHPHEHPHAEEHPHHHDSRLVPLTMYADTTKEGRRWAMAIDLNSCIGCNACTIACQAENNIPVVGKHEVTRGREMHWIRVDRYHEGDPNLSEGLQTFFQPVPCQQCEKAPCELVCPVGATVHSNDGLNDMVYNRCVGTRYCSNNCPYKVRRFNFFTFADWATESLKLGRNPEVTVRSRGVMEKCTYCVQRIRLGEIEAEREGRPVMDGEIVTACQAACPSKAIVFGDLADTESVVRRWKNESTNYGLLAELNTMPRTTYLAALRNPNPDMPKGA